MTDSLQRFRDAQLYDYDVALAEVGAGLKQSHWMWYIFPQIRGLGSSGISQRYSIENLTEARDYLADPVLGDRLRAITKMTVALDEPSARGVFGSIDALKLRSSMTLFLQASDNDADRSLFQSVLDKWFDGQLDARTLELLHEDR